jgi:Flp pilus assembly pilin Flp
MFKIVEKIFLTDTGASTLEYGIIAALISTALITTVLAMGVSLSELYQYLASGFSGAVH